MAGELPRQIKQALKTITAFYPSNKILARVIRLDVEQNYMSSEG